MTIEKLNYDIDKEGVGEIEKVHRLFSEQRRGHILFCESRLEESSYINLSGVPDDGGPMHMLYELMVVLMDETHPLHSTLNGMAKLLVASRVMEPGNREYEDITRMN